MNQRIQQRQLRIQRAAMWAIVCAFLITIGGHLLHTIWLIPLLVNLVVIVILGVALLTYKGLVAPFYRYFNVIFLFGDIAFIGFVLQDSPDPNVQQFGATMIPIVAVITLLSAFLMPFLYRATARQADEARRESEAGSQR